MSARPDREETPGRDTGRPRLHFTPRSGWINDPHGLTWHDGRYHLFFQHLPGRAEWELPIHWGHAVSDDLVHWTELPLVLSPGDGDDGIWSGCVVAPDVGPARLFYTSVRSAAPQLGSVRVASPGDEGWETWRKGDAVVVPPEDLDLVELRDPFVLREGDRWRILLGGGTAAGTALVLSWTSPDLASWTYDGVLAARDSTQTDPVWTGTVWECPQLFRVGERWVLLVSVWDRGVTQYEACAVGDLVDGRFHATSWQRLTHGPAHYAGSAFTDAGGRPCLLHWLRGVTDPAGRWAGALSVPHVVRLDGDRVVLDPHPVVEDACEPLPPGARREYGDVVLVLDDDLLTVDLGDESFTMPCDGGPVRLLVDGPVVEVFGPHGVAGFAVRAG
jgi:beta-fructofuranosidase